MHVRLVPPERAGEVHDRDRADGQRSRRWAVNTRQQEGPTPYLRALETAHALGRADGLLAVDLEPVEEPAAMGSCCHGLEPEALAASVWGAGAGTPPAGVQLNAPLWYAAGFREAVASARAARGPRAACDTRPEEPEQTTARERAVVAAPADPHR
jgi:hypothetical protein